VKEFVKILFEFVKILSLFYNCFAKCISSLLTSANNNLNNDHLGFFT